MKEILSVNQIHKQRKVYWIHSYKRLLFYVSKKYRHILKPKVKGEDSATRYYVTEQNLERFIKAFENNRLS